MRVLIDECSPTRALNRRLAGHGHERFTVQEAEWAGEKNGELLDLAEPHAACPWAAGYPGMRDETPESESVTSVPRSHDLFLRFFASSRSVFRAHSSP